MVEKVAFIGAGSMAEAVIAGIINTGFLNSEQIYVTNKDNQSRLQEMKDTYQVVTDSNKKEAIKDANVVVFATKPYDLEDALMDTSEYIEDHQVVISVIAGISTEFIQKNIGKDVAVIRTMPNTSAMIGYSATAIAKGKFATDEHLALTKKMFEAIGTVSIVKEDKMHAVTGISGSGPAYVYYLVEAMESAAEKEGLDKETAKELITQTIIGAGNMLKSRPESAATLRKNVTSPNGTTHAGIQTLEACDFQHTVETCVQNAAKRSMELGKD